MENSTDTLETVTLTTKQFSEALDQAVELALQKREEEELETRRKTKFLGCVVREP